MEDSGKKINYYNFSIFVTKSLNPDTDPTNVSEYLLIKDMKVKKFANI
jgi:hypothetical protein